MLALTQRVDDTIELQIPPSAVARVVRITTTQVGVGPRGRQVKLGFDAPREITILRDNAGVKTRKERH